LQDEKEIAKARYHLESRFNPTNMILGN